MFVKTKSGERLRVLIYGINGSWVISYDNPKSPEYLSKVEMDKTERIETPVAYVENITKLKNKGEMKRLDMLKVLIEDDKYITDKTARNEMIHEIKKEYPYTERTIKKLFFRYLALGTLFLEKHKETTINKMFDDAIQKYYYSAKKHSLRAAFELMIADNYLNYDGTFKDGIPTFSSFKGYYQRNYMNKKEKDIARYGLSNYQRNERILYGSAMAYKDKLGAFQVDETIENIYLVSKYDRTKVIGRPYLYIAVDTASQLICGVNITFEPGENAVMELMANCTRDKVSYCKEYGIDIEPEDWPCSGYMPSEIISDRGTEFLSKRVSELCIRYGVEQEVAQAYRSDQKGIVERTIGILQSSYESMLRGRGAVEDDCQERWSTDYRSQSVLTVEEYTKIILMSVVTLNKSRVIENIGHLDQDAPHTPAKLWAWFRDKGLSNLLEVRYDEAYVLSLPRANVTVGRQGIILNKMRYVPEMGTALTIGMNIDVAYDPKAASQVFILNNDKSFIKCYLSSSNLRYRNYDLYDVSIMKKEERKDISAAQSEEAKIKAELRNSIRNIVDQATIEKARDENVI